MGEASLSSEAECWKNWRKIATLNAGCWKRAVGAAACGRSGTARIRKHEDDLVQSRLVQSNDTHVVALALASGARLLYTDDAALRRDFESPAVVPGVPGRIFTSRPDGRFTADHQKLLDTPDLCVDPEAH